MALSIKSDEADRLARALAAQTGESLTDAVVNSLRERLERLRGEHGATMGQRVRRIQDEVAAMPVLDNRDPDDILGYDDRGIPA
jgi:antitoxin VapB